MESISRKLVIACENHLALAFMHQGNSSYVLPNGLQFLSDHISLYFMPHIFIPLLSTANTFSSSSETSEAILLGLKLKLDFQK